MTASSPETSSRRRKYVWGAVIAALILILFVTFSKQGSESVPTDPDHGNDGDAAAAELHRQLLATLDGLRPERLHVSSDEQNIVGDLNLWWTDFSKTAQVGDAAAPSALVGDWLGEAAAANVAAARFSSRDAAHIRNALMYRAIAASLVARYASDRERALAAFALVARHVSLLSEFVEPAPLGSLEVLLAGRGTADDRAWVFAEILRQLGIDCVVIEPKTRPAGGTVPAKLAGAIIEDEGVLLFDPHMGLPIPMLDDTAGVLPATAATFRDALQNDALFRQFDIPGGAAFPWSSAALAEIDVRFIIDSTYAAPRMLTLQTTLPEQFVATLFDGPPRSEASPSLEDRAIAAGADGLWTADAVSAWQYPEVQTTAFFAAGGESSAAAQERLATLYGPKVMQLQATEHGQQFVAVDSRRPLRVVRVQHLRGELSLALEAYGEVRSAPLEAGNDYVRQDAIHWIAVCQMELERYGVAKNTLKLLLRNYATGLWTAPAQRALATCEARLGHLPPAVELVQKTAAGDQSPDPADAYLARRWQAQAAAPPTASGTPAE